MNKKEFNKKEFNKKEFYKKANKYKLNKKYELAIENYKKVLELDK